MEAQIRNKTWIAVIFLFSCNFGPWEKKHEKNVSSVDLQILKKKSDDYCELSRPRYEENKYVVSKCDGLIFTSIHGVACDYVNINEFEVNGKFYRSPTKDCLKNGESKSTISKDMIIGLLLNILVRNEKETFKRFFKYSKDHNYIIGEAVDEETLVSRTFLGPGFIEILYNMDSFFSLTTIDLIPDGPLIKNKGFRAHLDVLAIFLRGILYGAINQLELDTLKYQSDRQPKNALYQAVYHLFKDGNQTIAYALLMDNEIFPNDRLPNNHENYCTDYLYQRDESEKDWGTCQERQFSEHYGTDFLLASYVIMLGR